MKNPEGIIIGPEDPLTKRISFACLCGLYVLAVAGVFSIILCIAGVIHP